MNTDPYSLDQLHDIVQPAAISAWPPAAGAGFLLALLLVWLTALSLGIWQRHRCNRYRRVALAQLTALRNQLNNGQTPATVIAATGELLKRTALVAYPRGQVASLSGDDWLQFLNRSAATEAFSDDAMQGLIHSAYQTATPPPSRSQTDAILAAARHWIGHHHLPESNDTPC